MSQTAESGIVRYQLKKDIKAEDFNILGFGTMLGREESFSCIDGFTRLYSVLRNIF